MPFRRIVCFGPGPQFKGGISNYTTALAKTLAALPETEVHIVSWTQQYPAIIPREFIDKSSQKSLLEGTDIQVHYLTNYNKPGTWRKTAQHILELQPDVVVFQWAIAIQGIPMGAIAKRIKRQPGIEVIFDLHFVQQKENSSLDRRLTKRGIKHADTYIVHALKTYKELQELFPERKFYLNETGARCKDHRITVLKLYHPIYDLFQPDPEFKREAVKQELGLNEHVFLFFGFIRKYKGLHNVIRAFAEVAQRRDDVSLLVCGESFWNTVDRKKFSVRVKNLLFGIAKALFLKKADDERHYNPLALIDELKLGAKVVLKNEFIPNEDVNKYFQVSDAVVLYYEYATPSGVESLSYNFRLPILATKVGHFPETITHGENGYLADAEDIESMADEMEHMIEQPIPRENVDQVAKRLSWENYANVILDRVNNPVPAPTASTA